MARRLRLGGPTSDAEVEAFVAPFRADFAGRAEAFIRRLFGAGADPDPAALAGVLRQQVTGR